MHLTLLNLLFFYFAFIVFHNLISGAVYSRISSHITGDWNACGKVMGLAPWANRALGDAEDGWYFGRNNNNPQGKLELDLGKRSYHKQDFISGSTNN